MVNFKYKQMNSVSESDINAYAEKLALADK